MAKSINIYEIARDTIESVLVRECKLKQANERAIKKSAFCTTWIISDGDGIVENGTSSCSVLHEWRPYIEIMFHNGADRQKLHDEVSKVKNAIIANLIKIEFKMPYGLFDFGTPIEWDELELTDNTAKIKITLTAKAYRGKS